MLEIEQVSVEKLIPYARNTRSHSKDQVMQIAASIREFGFTNPVLIDEADNIIAGHGRVLAARKVDMAEVPCIRLTYLSEAQKKAYRIADNKLALNAGWDIARPTVSKLHPTTKPIELVAKALNNSSNVGTLALDQFGGSGSTLIAAEQLNRACYMMELDPIYCDVIVRRWEQFTGKEAVLNVPSGRKAEEGH